MSAKLESIVEMLGATAEVMGMELSATALAIMARDLDGYDLDAVADAISRTRRECRRLTLADVIERIQSADGRPKPDEAWANAIGAMDESETVVWTLETAQAFAAARPLLELNDKTGARMAFKDAYVRLCDEARQRSEPVRWEHSLGWDADRRREVLSAAVQLGRLSQSCATGLLPPPEPSAERKEAVLMLVASNGVVNNPQASTIERERALERIAEIKVMLTRKGAA